MSTLICVGIGNTTVSFGIHDQKADLANRWSGQFECETGQVDIGRIAAELPGTNCRWRVASVNRPAEEKLQQSVSKLRPNDHYQSLTHVDLPITAAVQYPERVGMDRLAAAVAANQLRDALRPAIIVDAGTAITVDLVDETGTFQGGAILPGFRLVSRALAAGTDQLPEADSLFTDVAPEVVGKSTEEAIRSGLFWGGVGAIKELVDRVTTQLETTPQLLVAGGDARLLAEHLDNAAFVPDLVLLGILLSTGE